MVRSRFSPESPRDSWESSGDHRLESWKEIAAYLKRDVSTVQRWEKREGLPVHRQAHEKVGSVYAYKRELDSWRLARAPLAERRSAASGSKVWNLPRSSMLFIALMGALLCAAVALWHFSLMNPKSSGPLKVVSFTTYPEVESSPSFSPDGNQIAFVWEQGIQYGTDIYVKHRRGGDPLRLTSDGASKGSPVWSPDGRWIAYLRHQNLLPFSPKEVCVIPSLGGVPERKLGKVRPRGPGPYMTWTPDSESLIVTDVIQEQESWGLFLMSIDTGEKRSLTVPPPRWNGDTSPALSPDGRTLAFVRSRTPGVGTLLLLPLARDFTGAGTPRLVIPEGPDLSEIMWTAQGKEILYVSGPEEARTLWRVSASGGSPPEAVPSIARPGRQLTLSTQSNCLAFSDPDSDQDIWRLDLNNRVPARLISSTGIDATPDISADGTRILFASNRSGYGQLWICNRDGSNPSPLTSVGAGTPRWSPDGTQIIFDSHITGNADLFTVSNHGGKPRRITTDPANDFMASWSRDGRWIYFTSNRSGSFQVWKMDAAAVESAMGRSAALVQLTRKGGRGGLESPDGSFFYYAKTWGPGSIWKVPVSGGKEELLIESLASHHLFSVVEDGIYFVPPFEPGTAAEIRFYRFLTGRIESVVRLPERLIRNIVAEPDNRWLLLTMQEDKGGDIVVVENFR
jgi:Tol biopolymer transport system component